MRYRCPLFIFLAFFFLTAEIGAQEDFRELLDNYRRTFIPEKVFLHSDKDIYASGETIWAALYLVDGQTHRPDSISKVIYLELRNAADSLLALRRVFPQDGHSAAEISLPGDIPPGPHQLVAYTHHQRNGHPSEIFRKPIQIVSGLNKDNQSSIDLEVAEAPSVMIRDSIRLRFFPEGGDCVNGIPCRIAVYAESLSGQPAQVSGYLPDREGKATTIFQTNTDGVGTFTYRPMPTGPERAIVNEGNFSYALPTALPAGIHLNVYDQRDTFRVMMATNTPGYLQGASIVVHLRGIPVLANTLSSSGTKAKLVLAKSDLEAGIYVATVFDADGWPLAERLFFRAPEAASTQLQIFSDTFTYGLRDTVKVKFKIPEREGNEVSARLSYGVIPTLAGFSWGERDIRTWLLLNSDLDRPIPGAASLLFGTNKRGRDQRMENLLMTRGWRRFVWDSLPEQLDAPLAFPLETGIYLRGQMVRFDNRRKARPGKVYLSRAANAFSENSVTDLEGRFTFGPYFFYDQLDLTLQGRFRSGKKVQVQEQTTMSDNSYVSFHIAAHEPVQVTPLQLMASPVDKNEVAAYQDLSLRSLTIARNYDSLIIDLPVIDVAEKRFDPQTEERIKRTKYYVKPDFRVEVDDRSNVFNGGTVLNLIRTVPGVTVTGALGQETVNIRGPSTILLTDAPAFFVDGAMLDLEAVRTIPIQTVEFIDVIKGAQAAAFGVNGSAGAILIYTRKGGTQLDLNTPGARQISLKGYAKTREFATFDYQDVNNRNRTDFRTTLHWNPILKTNILGEAKDKWGTSDQEGEFTIIAHGITSSGQPLFGTASFNVSRRVKGPR